jgi:hypothetical protein
LHFSGANAFGKFCETVLRGYGTVVFDLANPQFSANDLLLNSLEGKILALFYAFAVSQDRR